MAIPFALSLSKYVNSAGTDVGFASLLGVALLALLYFAGARESRTLRDQLEDAHTRISTLESRLSQALKAQAARAAELAQSAQFPGANVRPGVAPAPAGVRSVPARSLPGAVSTPAVPTGDLGGAGTSVVVGAGPGSAAPALGSATTLLPIPEPSAAPAGVPGRVVNAPATVPVPSVSSPVPTPTRPGSAPSAPAPAVPVVAAAAIGGAAAYADSAREHDGDLDPEDTMFVPASTAAGANGRSRGGAGAGSNRGGGAPVAPPPMRFYDDDDDAPAGPPPRRTIPVVDDGPSRSRVLAGRMVGLVAAVVVVVVVVVVIVLATSSTGTSSRDTRSAVSTTTGTSTQRHRRTTTPFSPRSVKVSVLNATATTGLAGDVGKQLSSAGYTVPSKSVTNASVQTDTTTSVVYLPGYASAARHVAESLTKANNVTVSSAGAASQSDITSCGTPVTGNAGSCSADVIVVVGSDLASAAGGTSTGSGA